MEYLESYGIIGLFIISFLSATILPVSSEIVFLGLLQTDSHFWLILLIVATIGNTLGSILNYELGRMGSGWAIKKLSQQKRYQRIERWNVRWGSFMAFFSFIPLIGDLIPIYLGLNKIKRLKTYTYLYLGKFSRYILLIIITFIL